jgi:hypothetical protein
MIICYATKIGQTNKSIWEFSVTTVGNFQILHYHNDAKDEQSGANEESANHQIRETEEILLEIFKPDKDGDS